MVVKKWQYHPNTQRLAIGEERTYIDIVIDPTVFAIISGRKLF